MLKIGRENEGKYLGGREGRIGSLGGLRGHESAAGEGSAAVEFASIHCSDDSACVCDCEREGFEILGYDELYYIGDFILFR